MAETLEELIQIGKVPLGDDAPDPRQVRDESAEFTQLEAEMGKLSALSADPVDWREVVINGSVILRDKSKDLEVATYLCRGLWEREGYAGLRVGLTILRDIIQEHWDIAYPPKKKAKMRGGKISWLVDRVGKLLPNYEPKIEEKDTVIACVDLVKEIDGLLAEKLGDNAPILRELREPLQTYQQNFLLIEQQEKAKAEAEEKAKAKDAANKKPPEQKQEVTQIAPEAEVTQLAEVPKPVEVSKPVETAPQPAPQPAPKLDVPPPQSVASPNEIKKAFRSCHNTLYQIAKVKRAEKLFDPLPYRILRFAVWMSLEKEPFLQNGKFVAPGPPNNKIGECASLLEQGQHAVLIETAENMFANPDVPANAYWLDAHRFTAMALDALGAQYQQAKQAVIEECAAFLRRFPKLPELSFNDNTPFADTQTKLWIQEQVLVSTTTPATSGSEPAISPSDTGGDIQAWQKTAKQAKQLASKGQLAEGLRILQDGGKTAKGQREQFFWLLEQARFCYDTNHIELAIPQLEFLETQIERFALEEWEPMLSVEVARLLLMCHKKSSPTEKTPEVNKRLYTRLCRLDISAALAVGK